MFEDLKDSKNHFGSVSQDAKSFLGAALKDTLCPRNAESIHNVLCQPEWHSFRYRKQLALLLYVRFCSSPCKLQATNLIECDAQIDVNNLSCAIIHENIGCVPISKAQNVADNRSCRNAPCIIEPHCEPTHGVSMFFGKAMSHDRSESFSDSRKER